VNSIIVNLKEVAKKIISSEKKTSGGGGIGRVGDETEKGASSENLRSRGR